MLRHLLIFSFINVLFNCGSKAQELPDYITENSSSFTLEVNGFEYSKGEIRIAVFNSEDSYTKKPVYAVVIPVEEDRIEWNVPDLPFGEYAIAVYHDRNKNGKLDTNLLGIPKEDYGFSNNARGKFGPASWQEAKFIIQEKTSTLKIEVK
tara:strand:+ start:1352 stop:1801 length:450 start_codon:yes stop_codon:yes gene_type:complete